MIIYGDVDSGNCYKIKLLLSLLNINHRGIHVDILNKDTLTAEFLSLNPNGKIPVLVLDDGRVLSESNAILGYLAEGTELIPADPYMKAKMYQWMFFEQYSHEPFIAVARFINKYLGLLLERIEEYHKLQPKGHKALSIMNKALVEYDYLVGNKFTIADIALYAYTHVAEEGGFDLKLYPNIQEWCQRIQKYPKYVSMVE
ncbi:TPA: glutathione S-transferase family protein [Acinetobacter baumannii]|uniref:glutathione S-transferase family protein n=1 Tax=Acinetobacter baumannii TaxID=470 RepID=UPI0001AF0A95|nr:glutathione S-transferase family protein [Acinetobacter baumannii]ANC37159.1 glutathione S-transferase [Acinetobacter baumannii]EHU1903895.1 glutathione S-transferase family protein [Acinetobacter baumannii]EHU1920336.1 glutathione S-transferase family protein [Acinetobacter baumannii]EHU1965093.1 glutathione S-transferase family protein [Acinetobacter baumannii]EKP42735.1 glutathione S-transferase, C-terminal domain protein [Acinetobacter baumannii OIFC111]